MNQIELNAELGQAPFAGIARAPEKFWALWRETETHARKDNGLSVRHDHEFTAITPDLRIAEHVPV